MNQSDIDINKVRQTAKREWMANNHPRGPLLGTVEKTVPLWLFIITGVMFALSAPHTAATFDKLTPGWGWTAPLGVEAGLLYAAFRFKKSEQANGSAPRSLYWLRALLFLTAILVNGAGSLAAVVAAVGIDKLSLGLIFEQFGSFPATTQVALFLVPLAAFIIPIGTGVTGEGLAALLYDRDRDREALEKQWHEVEHEVVRQALFVEFSKVMRSNDAASKAKVFARSLSSGAKTDTIEGTMGGTGAVQLSTGETKKDAAKRLLVERPDLRTMKSRELADWSQGEINKNIWAEAIKEIQSNGHQKHE